MTRTLAVAILTGTLALAGAGEAAAHRVALGMGEQQTGMFLEPRYERLGLHHARVLADWDALAYKRQRKALDLWLAEAEEAGTKVLLSFRYSRHRRFPSPAEFGRAFRGFRERYPDMHAWGVWNEANHGRGYTARHPGDVARLYDAAVRECPSCRIVGADVLDISGMEHWIHKFTSAVHVRPRYWGLHNYVDANRRRTRGTRRLLRAVKGLVWFTETGGIVARHNPHRITFPESAHHAAVATRFVFRRLVALSKRATRVYIYQWNAGPPPTTWDSGLIGPTGRTRPAYRVVARALRAQTAREAAHRTGGTTPTPR